MNKKKKIIPELRFPEFEKDGEWVEKALGEVAPLQRGFDLPVDNIVVGDYPVVFSNGILKYHNEYKVKGPGVITGRSGTIGRVTFVEDDFWPHNTSLWVTNFFGNFPLFIFYYYDFIGLEQFGTGSGVPTLNRNDVHRHKILIPNSSQEQQKIASCLSSLDELIAAHNDKLEALKDHKKGLMQTLFPQKGEKVPKFRFTEFVKDGEWVEKRLGKIGEPLMCKRIFKDQTTPNPENGIPFYKIGTFGKEPDSYISVELYEEFKSKYNFPNKGDILISASGTIGRLVVYDGEPAYFQDSNIVWLGHDEKEVSNEFLFYCYSIVNWQTSDGGVIKRLYNSDLKAISIKFPENEEEQQKIASCLSALDALITAQAEKIEQLQQHKMGLMQGLFPKIV